MKYPFILFFRNDKYKYIDSIIGSNANKLNCTIHIVNDKNKLNKFYKQIYPILIIFENDENEYNNILSDFNFKNEINLLNRIIFISDIINIDEFN